MAVEFEDQKPPSKVRYLVVTAAMLMSVLLYLDRFCVSFAADYIREDLALTQKQMSWFLSAFFWSYALAQVPSGWLSDRHGARIMLVIYVLSWSFFTAMIGGAYSLLILLVARLGCGLGQAGAYPTGASVVSKWFPFASRGFASSLVAVGGRLGGAIAPSLTAFLIVVFVPHDTPNEFTENDILNGARLCAHLAPATSEFDEEEVTVPSRAGERIWELLMEESAESDSLRNDVISSAEDYRRAQSKQRTPSDSIPDETKTELVQSLNGLLDRPDLYDEHAFAELKLNRDALQYLRRDQSQSADDALSSRERRRFNRLIIEAALRGDVGQLYVRGWRPVMWIYGAAGILVAAVLWIVFRNRPEEHPWANAGEADLIASGRPTGAPSPHGKPGAVPLRPLLTSRSMWMVCVMQWGTNVGWVFLVTWLPRYLLEVHDVPILKRGLMATTPLLIGMAGMLLGGVFTDTAARLFGLRWGRRFPMMSTRFTAAMAYAACLFFAFQGSDSAWNGPWMFTAAFAVVAFSTDMGTGSVWAFKQDVGGRYVGSILGWGNMWGNLGAAVSPLIYDAVLGENPTIADWNLMFTICMGAFVLSGLCALGVDASIPIAPADEQHAE